MTIKAIPSDAWQYCLTRMRGDVPLQQFNTWIRPLSVASTDDGLVLAAPNRFIRDFVDNKYGELIDGFFRETAGDITQSVTIVVGDSVETTPASATPAPAITVAR